MRLAEVFAGVDAPVHAAEPFAVDQTAASEVHDDAGAPQAFDGFVEKNVGVLIVGQQGLRPRQSA